ncbi:fungal-specific transcription factor domain-containing protein [Pyrenochaeta sp. MPI-SDFR-AT-0127]|nr:fungal-specific transcription factor domain-containing protein [Pyrenochaeta sp. MPI-SDFR-AT-0127]
MTTLTIPASISKRKQACKNCRQRKKKCNAEHPVCSLCAKLGIRCNYTTPIPHDEPIHQSQIPEVLLPLQPGINHEDSFEKATEMDFMQFPGMNFDISTLETSIHTRHPISYPTPDSRQEIFQAEGALEFQQDLLSNFQLPDDDLLLELVELFFQHFYHDFPCFHKRNFLTNVKNGYLQKEAPLLMYAICCIASRHHADLTIRKRQGDWYEQAKFSYDLTRRFPHQGLHTIQAVLLLVYHAFSIGDFSSSWLFIGKAWRQVVALGMNRLDTSQAVRVTGQSSSADHEKVFDLEISRAKTVVEREEYRRTLWLLFMMDRNHAWPTGWPAAINELQFKVDIPISDSLFQALDPQKETSPHPNAVFTRKLNHLINKSSSGKDPLNIFHYLSVAHVILSRITELVHSLHDQPNTEEYADECRELDSFVVKFRLSLPRKATSILEAPPEERGQVVWLNLTLNLMAILIHYRCAGGVPVPDAHSQFALAVAAARSTAQIIKDAARISVDLLLSAHVGSSLYIAACVLTIQWRTSGDESLKEDIDLFMLVFDRMNEVFVFLGWKFKLALEHDLNRDEESIMSLKERGFKGLLADCSKWNFVKEEVSRKGINVDIT